MPDLNVTTIKHLTTELLNIFYELINLQVVELELEKLANKVGL